MQIATDLRNGFGTVRDQGQRPTCLAFSGSDLHGYFHGLPDQLSTEFLYHSAIEATPNADPHVGVGVAGITYALRNDGQPIEADWPYLTQLPADLASWQKPSSVGDIWMGVLEISPLTVDGVLKVINGGQPIILALSLTRMFYRPSSNGVIDVQPNDVSVPYRHAVIGVASGQSASGKDYILVRNSWGEVWGLKGYAWISKDYLKAQLIDTGIIVGGQKQ